MRDMQESRGSGPKHSCCRQRLLIHPDTSRMRTAVCFGTLKLLRIQSLVVQQQSFIHSNTSAAIFGDRKKLSSSTSGVADRITSHERASTSGHATLGSMEDGRSSENKLLPGLYVVGTPIGNLEDITLRALRVLRSADIVLAEDTRRSRILLDFYQISSRLTSFHEHNEHGKQEQVLRMLKSGKRIALISDAGMPLVSDPGSQLVQAAVEQSVAVFPIPGPSAVITALVASGLQSESFQFCGFLPPKPKARAAAIKKVVGNHATLIFFAPVHSLAHILRDLSECLSSARRCVVARELTKVHEEFFRGTLSEAVAKFDSREAKGEVTIVVEGASARAEAISEEELCERLLELLREGCSPSSAAKILSRGLNIARSPVYAMALKLKQAVVHPPKDIPLPPS